jgi:TatA/E family protein of Tat protein translocase
MLGMIGPETLMIVLVLALIIFGPKKLPEMGKSIGKGLQEFRKAQMDVQREIREGMKDTPSSETAPASTDSSEAASMGTPATDGQGHSEQPA